MLKNQLIDFIANPIWKLFKAELIDMRMAVLEALAKEENETQIRLQQGRAEVLEDIVKWPEMQLELFNEEEENND